MVKFHKPKISYEKISKDSGVFTVEPLERGFGYTLGNSLRRIMLSSIPGAAVTSFKIQGVVHEFTSVPGVKEDISDIILNLKQLVLKLNSEDSVVLKLNVEGAKDVTAKEIKAPADVEVVNPQLHIANLNEEGKLIMDLMVERGRGYLSAERQKKPAETIGVIPIDALFTPVRKVSFEVVNTRVGQRTDYDKLILKIETNGSLTPQEAAAQAATIINEHMNLFMEQATVEDDEVFAKEEEKQAKSLDQPIEELDLSVRSYNCLKRQGINTLEQLIACNEKDLMGVKNFGQKSIQEVKEKLQERNLSLQSS
ncbi:MAG TPA: DNA-directed RNA polymerase subunit alpha [Candidatus Subteraquimicrobiales bacterium]|uniref:DNA-directed RNA polymerase subunit alpha n=1 Tax=uncultured actinobacterium Rifle_16ft_4_minimus_550 TaxID=1665149 RepID=A0A0H4TUC5_9ACTN|nr:DNA-directed RNA polymerase subunit alpha, DNA-directed RNA polymerase subunit alpha [uncultured actinobacterium Rifle_16ft_4_minimus_550]